MSFVSCLSLYWNCTSKIFVSVVYTIRDFDLYFNYFQLQISDILSTYSVHKYRPEEVYFSQ